MLSIGHLYQAIDLMHFLADNDFTKTELENSFHTFNRIETHYLVNLGMSCEWLHQTATRYLKPTPKGHQLRNIDNPTECLRSQIRDYIRYIRPRWTLVMKSGRKKVKQYMTRDEIHCFELAQLLQNDDLEVIHWWDEFIASSFQEKEKRAHIVGRKGELYTLEYEEKRTGYKPKLMSLDVNFAGFDVLSRKSQFDSSNLYIEVKTSELPWQKAHFYLTRHEWEVFTQNPSSIIHLWCLGKNVQFNIVSYEKLKESIPKDQGKGKWSDVKIPFSITLPTKINPNQNPTGKI